MGWHERPASVLALWGAGMSSVADHGDSRSVLAEHAREVELAHGVKVKRFYDPPFSRRDDAPDPVRRWKVVLPEWFDSGSWLHFEHSFESLDVALAALEESGALDAIDAYWKAKFALSDARRIAFSKVMTASSKTDKAYQEILWARQKARRDREDALRNAEQ